MICWRDRAIGADFKAGRIAENTYRQKREALKRQVRRALKER